MLAYSTGWMCVWVCPSSFYLNLLTTFLLHDAHEHTDAHTRPSKANLTIPKWIKHKTLHYERQKSHSNPNRMRLNQTEIDRTEESHWTKLEPQYLCNHGNMPVAPWRQEEWIGLHKMPAKAHMTNSIGETRTILILHFYISLYTYSLHW